MSTTTNLAITEADENAIRDLVALAQKSQSDPEILMALHTADAGDRQPRRAPRPRPRDLREGHG